MQDLTVQSLPVEKAETHRKVRDLFGLSCKISDQQAGITG